MIEITEEGEAVMRGQVPLTHALPVERELLERLAATGPFVRNQLPAASTPKITRETGVGSLSRETVSPIEQSSLAKVGGPQPSSQPSSFAANGDDSLPDYYWTWRILSAGFTLAEAARIRGLDQEQLRAHARQAAQFGYQVEEKWLTDSAR